jgi:signal transduction histidine kinase
MHTLYVWRLIAIGVVLAGLAVIKLTLTRIQHWKLRAILDERERLALDMHDTLAQSFAGIGFQLQALRDESPLSGPALAHLEMAMAMVRSSHDEAKRSIAALRPEYLGESDLVEALCKYARRISGGEAISIVPSNITSGGTLPLQISDALFRIGEEAITNAIRHARLTTLSIALHSDVRHVHLTISDDGCGFTADSNNVGLGIRGMEKRARNIGAVLQIFGSKDPKDQGTSVEVMINLQSRRTLSQRVRVIADFLAGS